ncbi:SDR family NAD(P)-dependent oxidoreductase [Streptomyces klenkii]|uniref:SDR family NAD(P)-dependent oxidoreductase n=1 Tax=Streptomyces klenkii TaxID=1420899 RepID=UPI003410A947
MNTDTDTEPGNAGDIAIIGLALRLPGADTLEELRRHLDAGRSLISEVPAERWSKERYFGDPRRGAEKTSSIWGGFIEDADRFDASFFQISPREAETMDPQQRFALELAWRAIEDAGYRASAFAGTRTGVFMGVCHADYAELMERERARTDAYFPTGTAYSIISNRVSYFLDLQGPSITNDTACSSSLVSVYEAVTALRNGDCTTALAGGVNLCWSPKHFVAFSQASMLSRTGECRAFDQGADGYVRGEGGAVLLLKPLARARADGDPVHAVIKGVATNHGGRTSSLTVTNPAAQANLIEGLYTRAGIRPETVTYIEAHGPGTPVGDPIEIIALKRAFHALHEAQGTRPEPESCGIGSVKTNIGHLEGAAGVAGMAKVIGALAGRRLPATVNFEVRNKLIKLDGSPFRIVRDTEPWAEPPTGADGRPAPRRAGVSSFGFGGTNAHVVLEEHVREEHVTDHPERQPAVRTGPHLVPLSAKTPDRLRAVAEGLLAHLRPPEPGDAAAALRQPQDLADIAYTLRTGREPMPTRVAFVVASVPELTEALEAFLAGTLAGAEAHPGATVRAAGAPPEDGLLEAAGRWARGDAEDLPEPQTADGDAKPRRVRLPAYPFARERHWFKTPDAEPAQGPAALHPLLHRNTSGLAGQRYTSTFTGDEPFLAAHRVGGARVLPAVAYLEMARAAVADATGHAPGHPAPAVRLRDVVWTRPLIAGDAPVDVHVGLAPRTGTEGAGEDLAFEVTVTPGDATTAVVHGRGTAELLPSEALGEAGEPETLDLGALRTACRTPHAPEDAYAAFRAQGLDYGPAMRGLDEILLGEGQLLARIQAPALAPDSSLDEGFVLPPSVLDGAFQSSLVLMAQSAGTAGPTMPFALERIDIHRPCAAVTWAWVRRRPGGGAAAAFDIDLCDAEGVVGVRLRGLVQRTGASSAESPALAGPRVVTATCRWTDAPAAPSATETGPETVHAFLTGKAAARMTPGLAGTPGLTLTHLPDIAPGRVADGIDAALGLVLAHVQQVLAARPRTPHRFVVLVDDRVPRHFHAPLTGLLATVALENPLVSGRVVRVASLDTTPPERITEILRAEAADPEPATEIRHAADGTRRAWRPADVALGAGPEVPPLKEGGVYWVTGGLGGLGRHVARYFARRPGVTVVLSGRSAAGPASEEALAALRAAGVDAHYLPADTGSADDVARAVREITREHGSLDGIVHAAGVLRDAYVLRKEPADLPAVLEPKVRGVLNLDAATRALALDFFVVFSSVAGVYGNPGQADYAAANAFLDAFAHHRQALVDAGERTGRTAAVSWPLWADGGMTVDDVTRESMRRQRGWEPLPTEEGLRVLGRVLDDAPAHVVVAYGADPNLAHLPAGPHPEPVGATEAAALDDGALQERAEGLLKELLGEVIHRDPATMEATVNLIEYGIDSLSILEMTARLEDRFGPLSKTLFFEYLNIEGVAGYFVEAHRERLEAVLGAVPAATEETPPAPQEAPAPAPALTASRDDRHDRDDRRDIAIIGISGRYPGAGTLDELWTLLEEGRHTFEEVPRDRWDHDAVYSPDRSVPGKSAIRTGTFLRDIDKFDPRYFRVSKREAERMSPEVRLFLQAGVEALEDAGYSRETIQRRYQGDVAVLAGTMSNHYNLYGFQNSLTRGAPATGSYTGTLPNMLSYFYGLTGPSIFLDTMCSASSTCVHQAVQMLRAGECRMAVAGGVNLLLHPYNLITSSQEHFTTATSDVIRSFGLGADGTILGEGVGAVVLKPLADAERDGDHIHAVIKGTALSNAGVRNGFTVPNPHMQARAVEKALDDAGVDARTISYVEGHGSGTSLGDPIEVKALTTAFGKHTRDTGFCALGSVKSNTGHLLAAAGMAGLAKVVLQLREGKLAPSLHSAELNPDIAFADTPFRVQRELADWKPAVTTDGGHETVHPRRAGLTSIGAGGMNSHIILEEYRAATEEPYAHDGSEQLFVFSAMTDAALAEVLTRFRAHLAGAAEDGLPSIAHTLRVGKNELPRRWAFLAGDRRAALAAVDRYLAGDRDTGAALASHDPRAATATVTARTLATAWLGGKSVDWSELTGPRPPRRVSLPAYPFERVRCWAEEEPGAPSVTAPLALREKLHPFLGRNASDVEGLRYVLDVRLDDLLDYGHRHDKERAVAPTFAADLALAAAKASGFAAAPVVRGLRLPGEVPWASTTRLITSLTVTGAEAASGVVSAEDSTGARVTVAEFDVHPGGAPADHRPGLPVGALERDAVRALTRDEFLAELAEGGLEHDPLYCGVQGAYWLPDGRLVLALTAPELRQDHSARHITLAPHVLTAAAQGLRLVAKRAHAPRWARTTPYGIEEIRVSGDPADVAYVLFEPAPGGDGLRGHVRLLDGDGRAVGELTGVRCGDDASPRDASLRDPSPGDASLRDPSPRDALPRKEEGMTRPEPLGAPRPATEPLRAGGADPGTGIVPFAVAELRDIASGILKFAPDELDGRTTFDAFGFDSISLVTFSGRVRERFGVTLSPAVFFDLRTLDALGRHLAEEFEEPVREAYARSLPADDAPRSTPAPALSAAPGTPMPIAVVGAAGRFPGAPDLDTYWANLAEGKDSVTDFPVHRYGAAYAQVVEDADFPKRAGVLDGADGFDAGFFRVYPREAELMDPQHRLALETVWNAVEHSAYTPAALPKNTGVFLGVSGNDYATLLTTHGVEPDAFTSTGNAHSMLANRISYVLDVRGPSEPVDTACSSSLIAVHRAMEAIRSGACDAAVAGGVNLLLSVDTFVSAHRAGMLSPDGRCKTFASDADGYVRGEGVGAVVLKPLAAAERDGDAILGVLIGSAENHGGRANSLTAPSADAQAELVAAAMAAVDPDTVGYVEAHGTGTALGDPVEVRALTTAFRRLGARGRGTCGLGSVKTNIGHLEAAAGIAGLLKVLLAMRHRVLPATLNCREINPYIELDGGPFRIVREQEPWRRPRDREGAPAPRRAGVSSFGFGGANCHVVVEEYEDHPGDDRHEEYEAVDATDATHDTGRGGGRADSAQALIPLSARTGEQLHERARDLLAYLEKTDAPAGLHSIAWTLQTGRVAMAERVGWVVASRGELAARLREFLAGGGSVVGGARGRVAHDGGPTAQTPARPAATAGGDLTELLARWAEGADVDWRALHGARPPKRAHLPVYPFAYERHWIPEGTGVQGALATREAVEIQADPGTREAPGTPAAAAAAGTAHAPVAAGAVSAGAVPVGSVPAGAVSAGTVPAGIVPAGAVSAGTGALPVHPRTGARPDHGRDGALARPLAPRNAGPAATDGAETTAPTGTVLLVPSWVPKPAAADGAGERPYDHRVVILCGALAQARADVERSIPGVRCHTVTTTARRADSRFTDLSRQVFEALRGLAAEERDGTTLVQVVTPSGGDDDTVGTALAGLLRTLTLEHPRIAGQVIGLDGTPTGGAVAALVAENARRAHEDVVVRHRDGERAVREWTPVTPGAGAADTPWRAGGVYLITGGAGGIGAVVARRIARDVARPVLVLAGRRPQDGRVDALLGELRAAGAEARYERADVSRWEEVRYLVARIREDSGGIHGIVHSAGVLHDAALTRQTPQEWAEVLAPKVAGTVHLDRATVAAPLEFFLTFSSGAAVTGNRGQGAYATANAFLDEFAALRTARVAAGERSGRTLSLAWPLWKDGGMTVGDAARAALRRDRGLVPMESADGVAALLDAWRLGADRVWVHHGDTARVPGRRPSATARTAVDRPRTTEDRTAPAATARDTLRLLVDLFARVTKSAPGTVDPDEPLGALGLDSIMVVQLNKELSAVYGDDVSKTLFYERPTLRAVAEHLAAEHTPGTAEAGTAPATRPAAPAPAPAAPVVPATPAPREPIAVIGMSGRYPGAGNVAEFWENLKAGRDCVREIPADRWPLEGFFEPDREKAVATGRSYSKWGGFVDDFAGFDPLFFKIAPRDAYAMDPQERLFLQASWEVLEDAGYTREELARRHGRRVGVFAGVTKSGHARHGAGRLPSGETVVPGLSFASVSARTSYVLDLRGPSLTVDTMCSASLTAIHEACENLHRGSCEVALAGGVNLYTHPLDYTELCRSTMLSSDARCRSFGAGGDGFVPGEGVGCVLLKPLSRALADGDRILAVIRGTSVNHGGRTHGYTVPNPGAQAELVRDALDRAGVSARDVSYVEAHGTGTELGDPIEVKGLTTAFEQDTDAKGFCAIGSVKSSIGHLEAAAGIAGLTKAVLQLRHGQLVPSLHAEEPNPNVDLGRTPFFVQRELSPWRPEGGPRIAAVSSFGAGGSNAHVILEEYGDASDAFGTGDDSDATEHVVVLSARTPERLRAAAARLADFLDHEEKQHRTVRPADLAHTLRTGREAMKERLAVVVASTSELRRVLRAYLDAGEPVPGLHLGTAGGAQGAVAEIAADADLRELLVARWAAAGKLDKLAALWAGGVDLDWHALHDPAARRISLPAYPFARDRYWIGDLEPAEGNHPQGTTGTDRTTAATELTELTELHTQPRTPATPGDRAPAPLASYVPQVVHEKIAAALAMDEDALDGKLAFADYGVDSILAVRIVHELNEALSLTLPTSVLFDHSSADRLTAHLLADHGDSIAPPAAAALTTTAPAEEQPRDVPRPPSGAREPIAVVGMSGRFAGADSLDELWQHLADGDELVTEATRWDLTGTGDDASDRCTRGGFLDRIDTFDPMFFNISGVEASVMDPQQRLLLEESWKALEDAGHAGRTADRRVGVYVGCWDGDYQEVVGEDAPAQAFWGNTASFVPGRVAYFLNLKGPAIAVDTSCSSSLVAIDLACKDLWSGETEMALAGGVFVQATPRLYELAGRAGMLSPTGRCHTFDQRADGFVPGEGAGVLVLKRLSDAVADGDHIHGVIRGSGVNHDGATNGITAPSSVSQERLLRDVYETFDVDVERIGLVEAHGTGTKLGDPIEFRALTRAFRADTDKSGYCAVGSVKTNLGHTQFAAGVAGVLKVLLAMRHGRIPASLHFETANEAVPLAGSPFYPSTSTHAWETPGGAPRLGVVSSFGASGTNAHLVLEEAPAARRTTAAPRPAHLVVLSARSREQLARQVAGLAEHCRRETTLDTGDAAWTLVAGREHFAHRFACVVRDRAELLSVLDEGLDGPRAFTGEAAASRKKDTGADTGRDRGEECLRRCASPSGTDHTYRTDLGTLAELYVRGTALDYDRLFPAGAHLRVPLPTYPFARESHWAAPTPPAAARTTAPAAPSHPLVRATSPVSGEPGALTATTTLTGDETLLRDHTVHGQRILPGVAHLEMARETAARALGADATTPLRMRNVTWVRPLAVEDGPQDVDVLVRPAHDGALTFKVASRAAEPVVFSEGTVALSDAPRPEPVDLAALRAECPTAVPAARVAEALRAMGIHHGDTLRAIDEAYAGRGVVLARLALPATAEPTGGPYVLHPSLMDSAVQASIALHLTGDGSPGDTAVPFALGQLELFAPCTASMWAVVRVADSSAEVSPLSRLDIDLVGPGGEVHVRMTGYASRRVTEPVPALHAPVWDAVPAETFEAAVPSRNQRVLVVGGTPEQRAALTAAHPDAEHWRLAPGAPADEVTRAVEAAGPVDHLLWLAPGTELAPADAAGFVAAQEDGVIAAFRMIKALVRTGHDARPLGITLVTHRALATHAHEDIRPAHAGLHGLFGSLGREYTNWTVRRVDLDGTDWPADLTALPAHSGGDTWVRRTGQWLARRLAPCEAGPRPAAPYRKGGVYVVIGGAGGLGTAWTRHVVEEYGAKVVWLGRRAHDASIDAKLRDIRSGGGRGLGEVSYLSADATDPAALRRAHAEITARHGRIHGVVQAALVLRDQTLAAMDEATFRASLAAKVDAAVAMAEVFADEALDFALFFSSIQSFATAAGQGNYAAGCTFGDSYAHFLSRHRDFPVKVMNWGWWGSLGSVASDFYRERMTRSGLLSIEPPEAMAALDTLLGGPQDQLSFIKMTKPGVLEAVDPATRTTVYPRTPSPVAPGAVTARPLEPADRKALDTVAAWRAEERDPLLARMLRAHLDALGAAPRPGDPHTDLTAFRDRAGIHERYTPWLEHSLRAVPASAPSLDEVTREWDERRAAWSAEPDRKAELELVDTMLRALPGILTSQIRPTDVMFPRGSVELVEGCYRNNQVADTYNRAMCDAAVAIVTERLAADPGARLRVLEIGAGTGGTSAGMFAALRPYSEHIETYTYTDLSQAFLNHARASYGPDVPYLTCARLDAEQPLAGQGIDPGSYDLVIAANVLHATRDTRNTLRNAKAALRDGGWLLLNELSAFEIFGHLTFGLLEGWWLFEDTSLRVPGSPALSPESWREVLEGEGFPSVVMVLPEARELGQQIIAARSDGIARQRVVVGRTPGTTGERSRGAAAKRALTEAVSPKASPSGAVTTKSPLTEAVPPKAFATETVTAQRSLAGAVAPKPSATEPVTPKPSPVEAAPVAPAAVAGPAPAAASVPEPTPAPRALPAPEKRAHSATANSNGTEARTVSGTTVIAPDPGALAVLRTQAMSGYLRDKAAATLRIPAEKIDPSVPLADYGMDSILVLQLTNALREDLGDVPTTLLFDVESVEELAEHFLGTGTDRVDALVTSLLPAPAEEPAPGPAGEPAPAPAPERSGLSQAQLGLWLTQRISPDTTAYHVPLAFEVCGELDESALEAAVRSLTGRHPVLGAVFREDDGVPYMETDGSRRIPFERAELVAESHAARVARVRAKVAAPFDLADGPLVRAHLLTFVTPDGTEEACRVLLVTAHHIVVDGISAGLLVRSLTEAYRAAVRSEGAPEAAESAGYAEFTAWEAALLDSPEGEAHLAYWAHELRAPRRALALPGDRPLDPAATPRGEEVAAKLSPELSAALITRARERRAGPSVVFLASYMAFLHRITGESDLVVGLPAAGRPEARFRDVVGHFVNLLPIRCAVDGDATYGDLLQAVRRAVLGGLEHAAYPFPAIVRALDVRRDGTRSPLVRTSLSFQNFEEAALFTDGPATGPGELRLRTFEGVRQQGEFELEAEIFQEADGFRIFLKYDANRFDAATAQGLLDAWCALLEHMAHAPDGRVGDPAPSAGEADAAATLCALFAETLGRGHVSPGDDFFTLGGDSLQATRLAARAGRALGVELSTREVFAAPTPAALAALAARPAREAVPARPVLRRMFREGDAS